MMAGFKRLEYLPPPEPSESINLDSQFYMLLSNSSCEIAISGSNVTLLKSVITTGAAFKTQIERDVEIERISIHLPTSEGIVRMTPESAHLLQLEVLPLMYRNGCVEVPVTNLLHEYIQAVLGSPIHINYLGLTGNIVIIENLQIEPPRLQSVYQPSSNGAYVLSVHYVLGVLWNRKRQSKNNKAKFFALPSLDRNVEITKLEAYLLGVTPIYSRFEEDLGQGLPVVQTSFYQCTKLRNDSLSGKKKCKKLNVQLNLYLDNGMIEFTPKELFALFFQRTKDFIHNIDRNMAAPKCGPISDFFTIRNLDKSLRMRIAGYSYRTGILKNQVVILTPEEAPTHKIMPVCINKSIVGLQYLDVYNPNVNHMMQSQLVLGNSQWTGRIVLIEIVKDQHDCFKYILGVMAENVSEIPRFVSKDDLNASKGVDEQTVLKSYVGSAPESRSQPLESLQGDAELIEVYTYLGNKQLTRGDVDFLKPSQVSDCNGFPDALESMLRPPQTLKKIINRLEQQLNTFNSKILVHECLTLEQSEGVRLKILKQGDLLSKHLVTDQFSFVLPQDMENRRIHCYHIQTMRGYVVLFPNVMDEFEAEIVPLSISGLFVKVITDFKIDSRLMRMLLPFVKFPQTNKEGRLALIETRPLECTAEGQSEDSVLYMGMIHHRWYESDKMQAIDSGSIELWQKCVCMTMPHGELFKLTYREARCVGLQNRTKHNLKSQNMPQEITTHLKKTSPIRTYRMTADSICYNRCELSTSAALQLKIGRDSCFKLVVIDSNDKYDIHSYVMWTSKGLVNFGPHAVYGQQIPTMYFTIDLRLSRRGGLKIIPFCLGKACISVTQKDLSSPAVIDLLKTRSTSSNARVILIYCVQSEGNKEASQTELKVGYFLGLMVNVARHSLCPKDTSDLSAVDELHNWPAKWGLNTYQYLTGEILENVPFRISDKEMKFLCSENHDTIFYSIPMIRMGLFRIQGYHVLTSKGIVALPSYGVIAMGLGVAAIDIDPQMNVGEGFKVIPIRTESFLVGLKCLNIANIQLQSILNTEVKVKKYSRKGRVVLIETQAQYLLGILVGDWDNFSFSSHYSKLETYEYTTLNGSVSLDRNEVVKLGLQQEKAEDEALSSGGSKLSHKIELTSNPNKQGFYFPEQSELTALNFLSPAPGDPIIGWKRMTNLTVTVTHYHILTSKGKLIIPHSVVESMDLRVLPIVLKSSDDYFVAGAVTRQLAIPRITHILSFATRIGRIVAIEIVMQEADKIVFEPNKYLFGVMTRIPKSSEGKAVKCCIRTINQGLIDLPYKEFVGFGFKDVANDRGASITVFGEITDTNAPVLGISKWNASSIRECLENTMLFFTTAERVAKYLIESCFILTSDGVVEISQSYFDSEGIKLVPLSIEKKIFFLKTINITYPQIKSLLETTLIPISLQKKCRIVFLKVSCEADFFIERRMQKERQSLSFCGGDDYYLLGVLIPPWNRPKSRSERCDNSKRSIYPTPGGNINISYKDSALLGLRQVHSDSEGGFRKYTICSDKELHFPDDEETRATVEKKVAPISSITMCNISDVPAPPKLSMAATSKVLLKLTKGIANVTNGTSNSEELLHLQEVLGNTLILMLPLSISQRVVVSFQIATSKRVVRLSGSTVLDKLFRALPWEFSREEQGYRLVPLCINDQVVAVKQVCPIHTNIVKLMRMPIVLEDLNVNARLVVVQTLSRTSSASRLTAGEQLSDFLGIMFNNRGLKTIPRNSNPLTHNYVTLPTLDGPIQIDRKESIRLGFREPHSDSEYGSDEEVSTSMPSNSSSPRLPEIKDKLKRPASSPPNSDPSKIYKASAEYNGKVQSHHPRYEEPQEHNSLWSGSESSTRFDAGSSTSSGRSQHTNAPPNRVLHCPQDPRRALINKYAAQSGYQHNQPTSSGLPPTGNSSNPAPLMRGSSSGYGNSLNPNLVPPTTANSVMSGYGNRPQPVPPPSNINAAAISRLEPGPGSRFDHSNNYGNQTESRNVTLDQGYPSTSHSAESTCQRTPEETEFKQSLVKAKSDLVHAWAKWFSGTERHPRYNDIWNGFCSQRIKELQTQGKRPNDQDLLVEWKVFWTKTLKEMFTTECGIMFENISNRYTVHNVLKREILKEAIISAANVLDTNQPISAKDNSTPNTTEITSTSGKDDGTSTFDRADMPLASGRDERTFGRADIPSVTGRDGRTSPPPTNATVDDRPTSLVSVLRLLMAIEEKLGSFSTKIVQLLHCSLRMERNCVNSSNSLLEDESVCIVIEAVGEKLRGQILAGMVSGNEERVMQRTIMEIEQMLNSQRR